MNNEMKYCKECGKQLPEWEAHQHSDDTKEWGDPNKLYYLCWKHENEFRLKDMKERIQSGEEENPYSDILGSDGYYCPHCGEYFEVYDDYELYTDGDHDMTCPECGKNFVLTTSVSYSFETEKMG